MAMSGRLRGRGARSASGSAGVAKSARGDSGPRRGVARATKEISRTFDAKAHPASGVSSAPSFPPEIWMKIFSNLDASDLLHASCVSRLWYTLSSNNVLWRSLYRRYVARARSKSSVPPPESGDPPLSYWKKACISSCIEFRNQRALSSLKNVDPFSGLPKHAGKAIQQAGIHFKLALVDGSGSSHFYDQRDSFFHSMSVAVRWYALDFVPVVKIVKLRLYAASPVVYDHSGQACRNSPCQMTLLDERDLTWLRDTKKNASNLCGSDSMVDCYACNGGYVVATWKDGGELAFVAANLPLHNLVQRCLPAAGSSSVASGALSAAADVSAAVRAPPLPRPPVMRQAAAPAAAAPGAAPAAAPGAASPPIRRLAAVAIATADYVGLHTCQCAVELRSYRKSFWKEQFLDVDYRVDGASSSTRLPSGDDGLVSITVIKDCSGQSRFRVPERPQLTWVTDLFKNITPDCCIVDLTLFERQKVILCISGAAKLSPVDKKEVSFDRAGREYALTWSDQMGSIAMELSEDGDGGASLAVNRLSLSLRTSSLFELPSAGSVALR